MLNLLPCIPVHIIRNEDVFNNAETQSKMLNVYLW